jgi:hypothetical protein
MATITHTKVNALADWTQPQLDAIIAGGAPPLPPPGTVLAQVVQPTDWNDTHQVSDIVNADIAAGAGILLSKTNISLTTTGSSGAATLNTTTGVLNIPQYSGGGGGAPTGAEYVVLSTNGSLTHERVLTAGNGIGITDGGAGNAVTVAVSNLKIGGNFQLATGINTTIYLIPDAIYAATINSLKGLQTDSGTITVTININGTPVTGLSAISVTSTPQDVTATALNTITIGDVVTLVTTSNSSAVNLRFSMEATR